MTRMTTTGYKAAFAADSDEVWLVFLTIDHPSLGNPLRFVRNSVDVTRLSRIYTALMFDIQLPGQHERQAASASLSLPNVDRRITDALRPLAANPDIISVEIAVALASAPDATQHGPWLTGLRQVQWNADTVEGSLIPLIDLDQNWPVLRMDNANFPGLYPG